MSMILLALALVTNSANAMNIVSVIDTGLNINDGRFKHLCKSGHKDFTGFGISDVHGHGTHVAGIIDEVDQSKYCIVIIKYYHDNRKRDNSGNFARALKYAASIKSTIVNASVSGPDKIDGEYEVYANNPQIRFIVAAGNNGRLISGSQPSYPASFVLPNITPVGALDGNEKASYSNYGSMVKTYRQGKIVSRCIESGMCTLRGTSQATAVYTAGLIK
jgi:subtilisin family serine protease